MTEAWVIPVVKTVATSDEGIDELLQQIAQHSNISFSNSRKIMLLAEKAWRIIRQERMKDISKKMLLDALQQEQLEEGFNLYRFVKRFL